MRIAILIRPGARPQGESKSYSMMSAWYDLATDALIKVGDVLAGRITADRAVAYAQLSGSPSAHAYSARSLSIVLRHQGQRQLAQRAALKAADEVEKTGLRAPLDAAAYVHLLCTTAYSAAVAGDKARARDLITEAAGAACRFPAVTTPGYASPISRAQVRLYEVGVHWALGDAGRSLHSATNLHPAQFPTRERRARFHTDLARSWWQAGSPQNAAAQLLAAHAESPSDVACRPSIRKIAQDIARLHPRVDGAPELAAAVGLT